MPITPEEVRAGGARFERRTRRRNKPDFASFALVLLFMVAGVAILEGVLARVGALLLALWAIIGLYVPAFQRKPCCISMSMSD